MENPLRSKRTEWFVTLPSFVWLALFFAVPALIVLAFTFHGHDVSGGVGAWSMSTWREPKCQKDWFYLDKIVIYGK